MSTNSSKDFRLYMHLNVRTKLEPCERFTKPVTSAQEYGWRSDVGAVRDEYFLLC
jgi:hypothetical protein